MSSIKEYLFGVICAAILCAVVMQMSGKGGFCGTAIKLISGVFMLLAMVSPVMSLKISAPSEIFSNISLEAEQITSASANSSYESICGIIKEETRTYILDKANTYGVDLSVEVILSEDELPQPIGVQISGDVSPYTKKILINAIENELGIQAEAQIWS